MKIHTQRYFVPELLTVLICLAGMAGFLPRPSGGAAVPLVLKSPDFTPGGDIPKQFTCEGANISPALKWNDPPPEARSFVVIADDPDAPVGTWVHWVIFDLPATLRALLQNFPKNEQSADGSRQGRNDPGEIGYGGPCPPSGKPHRYFFKLYALDAKLNLAPGATKKAERTGHARPHPGPGRVRRPLLAVTIFTWRKPQDKSTILDRNFQRREVPIRVFARINCGKREVLPPYGRSLCCASQDPIWHPAALGVQWVATRAQGLRSFFRKAQFVRRIL